MMDPNSTDRRHLAPGIGDLVVGTWALVALGLVLEAPDRLTGSNAGSSGFPGSTRVSAALDLLLELGMISRLDDGYAWSQEVEEFLSRQDTQVGLAHIRSTLLQAGAAIRGPGRGWSDSDWTDDAEVIRSQGRRSRSIIGFIVDSFTRLDPELIDVLASDSGRFLDAGAGAGDMSLEIITMFPNLRVVALEPGDLPFRLLHDRVVQEGHGQRVQTRRQRIEHLTDTAAYHLAWIPLDFISPDVIEVAVFRVSESLLPGGWLAIATPSSERSPASAAARFRASLWGGSHLNGAPLTQLLQDNAFESVRTLRYSSSIDIIVARRH